MLKLYYQFLTIIFLTSCGLSSYEYIEGPTVNTDNSSFTIDFDTWQNTTGFLLYSRYYLSNSKVNSFKDLTISDTKNDSEGYLEDLGFTLVTYSEYKTDDDFEGSSDDDTDVVSIIDNSTFTINYDSSGDPRFTLTSDSNGTILYLKSNYMWSDLLLIHNIGYYDDINGINFLSNINDNWTDVGNSIFIEFAIISIGISSELIGIESIPVYFKAYNVQIN